MLITKCSSLTGLEHDIEIDINESELASLDSNCISPVWDMLTAKETTFLETGMIYNERTHEYE